MRTFSVVATIVLGFMAAPTVSAQERPSPSNISSTVTVGTRVRVTSLAIKGPRRLFGSPAGELPGVVTAIDESSLTVAGEKAVVNVPLSSIKYLEISRGMKRNTWMGLGMGLLVGLAAAITYGTLTGAGYGPPCECIEDYFGTVLLVGGGAIGTTVGAVTKSERWRSVSFSPPPAGSGQELGPAVAFAVRF